MWLGPVAGLLCVVDYFATQKSSLSLRYHLCIGFIAFFVSLYDKFIAKSSTKSSIKSSTRFLYRIPAYRIPVRVPESTFYLLAFLGGGWGLILSFIFFNHKVRKTRFLVKCGAALVLRILLYSIIS